MAWRRIGDKPEFTDAYKRGGGGGGDKLTGPIGTNLCEIHAFSFDAYASVNQDSISWDNGLSPIQHQAIICTNDGILFIGSLGTNFN